MASKALKDRQLAYRAIFRNQEGKLNESAKAVLEDLNFVCFGTKSVFSKDALEMARNAGRQEVFHRIIQLLEIDYTKFYTQEEIED